MDLDSGVQAHLDQSVPLIRATDLHALGYTGEGVTVAILDSGVDTDHTDLSDDLDGQECFCTVPPQGGSGCCPNGVVSSAGVARDTRIVAIRIFDNDGNSCCSSDVVAGLDGIIANRPDVDIVNMSLGTFVLFSGNCDNAASFTMAYASAINTLRANGVATFVSSGNNASGTQRADLCGAESNCSDGADNDSDGLTDCSDPDCFDAVGCAAATFSFTDTGGDDVAPAALWNFLNSLATPPADSILFSIAGGGLPDFKWCAERADFYRDTYVSLGPFEGLASTGPWSRWHLTEGGSWTGPVTDGFENRYGGDCLEPYAWCAEPGLAGRDLVVLPDQATECEAADLSYGCSYGAWVFTLRLDHSRLATCGF